MLTFSMLLFALFIEGIHRTFIHTFKGVIAEGEYISLLLFADNFTLILDTN